MIDDHDDDNTAGWDDVTNPVISGPIRRINTQSNDHPYLFVLAGLRVGEMIGVNSTVTLGRGTDVDFRVPDEGVSRHHLRIVALQDGSILLTDLETTNGTFVNGKKVNSAVLNDGDKIQIGSTAILKFSFADKLEVSFQESLFEAAQRDALTSLFNRRYFKQQLTSELSFTLRRSTPISLILFDLDHFKLVNDNHGHPIGDAVLVGFSHLLSRAIRAEDLAARIGGEEFALICRDVPGPVALQVGERIRQLVESSTLTRKVPSLKVTLSAGVAALPDPRISTVEQLVEAADKALYESKNNGRNRVTLYE
ncbi:MAG: GGDEF domain-containing protein [Deltaproteobacteria bacterium]|nr:GGDEF domain-containing protein [Deltaproteobacteria bacterium]